MANTMVMANAKSQPVEKRKASVAADKNGQSVEKFYARSGNSSQEIPLSELNAYMKARFHN